jgi:predicted ribosomally synthesized peptide with nif11-like leader
MSKGAKDFIDEVGHNAELRQKIFKQSSEMVMGLAKQHGFEFSKQELQDALHQKLGVAPPAHAAAEADDSNCIVVIVAATARSR